MLVHEYDQVDLDVLWDVTQNSIPDLLEKLSSLVNLIKDE